MRSMPDNVFSEREAGEILQRAAQLQEESGDLTYSAGVTWDELTRIAGEAGISESFLLKAAESGQAPVSKLSLFNLVEENEIVLQGELDERHLGEVIDSARDLGNVQQVQALGTTVVARISRGSVFGTLRVSSRRGRTRVSYRQTPFVAYFAGLHAPLILCLPLVGIFASQGLVLPAVMAPLLLVSGGFAIFYSLAQSGKRKARALFREVVENVRQALNDDKTAHSIDPNDQAPP